MNTVHEQLKLDNQLCFPFYALSRLIIRAYQDDLDRLGITYPQYLVLLVLWEKDKQTVNEIAQKLILNTNTVTPLLKRMEVQGLIVRKQSAADQRKVMVTLTELGAAMSGSAANIPENMVAKMKVEPGYFDDNEIQNLKQTINKLIELYKGDK
jgi:DNA-binding MarR family transcriptional regulator